jgi:hypothetical protein
MSRIKDHPIAQLLVEGNDDFHVVHALFQKYNVPARNLENPTGGYFSVKDCAGIDRLLEQIPVQLKNLQKLGLIIDADSDIQVRWQSLRDILRNNGFALPENPDFDGTIISQNGKTIGIWLMPNNDSNGMLEDFMQFLIPDEDRLLDKATEVLGEIEDEEINNYNLIHKSKALIHTWLAWQETPGTPLGKAITTRYLATENTEISDRFINWITRLFVDEETNS